MSGRRRTALQTTAVNDPAVSGSLLAALPDEEPTVWVREDTGLVGWGQLDRLEVGGTDALGRAVEWFAEAQREHPVEDEVGLAGTGLVMFGSVAFDGRAATSVFVIPRVVLGRTRTPQGIRSWRTASTAEPPLRPSVPVSTPGSVRYSDGAQSADEWERTVARAVGLLRSGEIDKIVLARDLLASTENRIDIRYLLNRLEPRWPGCWTFAVDGLVGATPEILLRRNGSHVFSRVLAGTMARGADRTDDEAIGRWLLESTKNRAEHRYAVASLAEALGSYCATMSVPESPYLHRLSGLMHLATDVTGELSGDPELLDLVNALHPTAAVCGTPRDRARDLIAELEGMDRGRYAGPVGWVDAGGNGEWGLALRCAAVGDRGIRLYAGCGIVADSDPEAELAEAQLKFRVMRDALENA